MKQNKSIDAFSDVLNVRQRTGLASTSDMPAKNKVFMKKDLFPPNIDAGGD